MMRKSVLTNGLTVITDHNEKAISTLLSYYVKAGGHLESGYPFGIAHFLEHMMFNGTPTRTKEQITELAEASGGRINAGTGSTRTQYYMYTPYDEWQLGVELLTDIVFRSTFPEEELAREKKVVIEEIKRSEDNPREYGGRQLLRVLRGMHPERASILGTEASVASIAREHLIRFHQQYYRTTNAVFVANGYIDHDALTAYMESLNIAAVDEGPAPVDIGNLIPCPLGGRTIYTVRDIRQTQLHWGMYGPDYVSADKYAGYVALHILGGGSNSRLRRLIRSERGLAYDVYARLNCMVGEGFITGYVGTDPQRIEEARNIIIAELNRIRQEKVTEDELYRAKKAITGSYLIAEDKPEAINARLAYRHLLGEDGAADDFAVRIREVEADDVLRFAQTYLDAAKMLFIQVGREDEGTVPANPSQEQTA